MHSKLHLSPLAACVLIAMSSSVQAADPVNLQATTFQRLKQQFHVAVPGVKQVTGVSADSLQFVKKHSDRNLVTHTRLQQQYAGFKVFGGYAIVHSTHSGQALLQNHNDVSMNGVVYTGLQNELGKPAADFVSRGNKALEQFIDLYKSKDISEQQVTPMVYIDDNHQAHWAYKVSVFVRHDDKIPERPTAIIDAESFKPFIQWNDLKTEKAPVKGRGFGGNQKMGEYEFGSGNYPYLELTREADEDMCFMENDHVKVVDMEHRYYSSNKPMQFACVQDEPEQDTFWTGYQSDGYDRDNGAFSPTNDALYAGYVIKHMYHDWYGVEALVKSDGSPMQLVMRVHYGYGYENAYWDGKQMTFGDGEDMMYPLVSLGVGAHEISHGFTEQHSELEYFGQSGGMNEAFSDMAAQAAEFYSTGVNSWQIGPEIMKEDSGYDALRYMDMPSRDGISIDRADQYYGGLDVHYSSGVFNHLYYLIANQPGWDARKAFDVMVKANMDYWTPYSTFREGGCGVLNAALDLGYSAEDVKKSLDEVAIDYEGCFIHIPEPKHS
ncbi:zinc metalloprotease ProA [Legionella spiritensis]|uniref:Neutral metalloproteinase n=2 Tax=Legionella spiritensis TaxID=452 RepID=A0A0W0ZAX2_LEGSP|nr:M4 family metallopeptidase [Legionella spiritensis]KTD65910.1 zinc metalloproteinase precursor [Legionella spiritensis]SNV31899.1 zinc metalloprotease [Legionella spiritensis]VEG92187.1 zinc metalloprotease [Legionella spiritensis]